MRIHCFAVRCSYHVNSSKILANIVAKKSEELSGRDEMKHTEDTLRNVDARSEGDTAGTMTVGERGGSVTRSSRK